MKRAKEQKRKTAGAFPIVRGNLRRIRCWITSLDAQWKPSVMRSSRITKVHLVAFSTKEQEALTRVIEYPEIKRGRLELALHGATTKTSTGRSRAMLLPEIS